MAYLLRADRKRRSAARRTPSHPSVLGEVVGDGPMVGTTLVPDHQVMRSPLPPALDVGIVEAAAQHREDRLGLVVAHADDAVHREATEVDGLALGEGMHPHQRMDRSRLVA